MIQELRSKFLGEFIQVSRQRIRRSLDLMTNGAQSDLEAVALELHLMAGEAGLIGLDGIRQVAKEAETTARHLARNPHAFQRPALARLIRSAAKSIDSLTPNREREAKAGGAGAAAPSAGESTAAPAGDSSDTAWAPRAKPAAERRRALVVEDSPLSASLLAEALEQVGFATRISGDDLGGALEIMRDFRPDVAILDLHMPGCDTQELCSAMRSDDFGRSMLIVVVTAVKYDESRNLAQILGANAIISKNDGLDPVVARVEVLLAGTLQ